jgi:hypothetical protein
LAGDALSVVSGEDGSGNFNRRCVLEIQAINSYSDWPRYLSPETYALWLHDWLKPYTDEPEAIRLALDYALESFCGGAVFFGTLNSDFVATAVFKRTGIAK